MRTETQPGISIVLPCYNPAPGWCGTLQDAIGELTVKLPGMWIEYIVSNDGSTHLDHSYISVLSRLPNVVFLDNSVNEGKGSAIRKGALRAEGDFIVYTDIDFPFGTDPIVEMVRMFRENPNCCFIYGNRRDDYFKKLPLKRWLVSKVLRLANWFFLDKYITDTQAGIKGLRRNILPDMLATQTKTFIFEIELIRKLLRKGISIQKVDVSAKSSIVLSDFSMKVLFREAVNFTRITILSNL